METSETEVSLQNDINQDYCVYKHCLLQCNMTKSIVYNSAQMCSFCSRARGLVLNEKTSLLDLLIKYQLVIIYLFFFKSIFCSCFIVKRL